MVFKSRIEVVNGSLRDLRYISTTLDPQNESISLVILSVLGCLVGECFLGGNDRLCESYVDDLGLWRKFL